MNARDGALPPELADRLRERLGPAGLVTDAERLLPYRSDEFPVEPGTVLAVLRPANAQELADALRIVAEAGLPLVPRGAGSGLAGASVPREAVVVSTERLDRILEVDPWERRAVTEPGVITADLDEAAEPHGLRYLPDPASQSFSSIGGNVATGAGGPHCLRHGVTADHVIGLEVVLPDGETVRLLRGEDGGLDLAGLFVGSEGTMGVVTRIEVRLVPRPPSVRTALALFDELGDAAGAVSAILSRTVPVALELMDGPALEAVESSPHAAGLPTDVAAALLVETEGFEEEAEADLMTAGEALMEAGARDVLAAADEGQRARLWKARREAYHALEPLAPDLLVQDMTVPPSALPEVLPRVREICDEQGIRVVNFFHAGDGNLHPNLLFDGSDPEERERVKRVTREIAELCVGVGGTITGEHGVGLDKRELMPLVFTPTELSLQRRVRAAFDPDGRCNPGKVFPEEGEDQNEVDVPRRDAGNAAGIAASRRTSAPGAASSSTRAGAEVRMPPDVDALAGLLREGAGAPRRLIVTGEPSPDLRPETGDDGREPIEVVSTASLAGIHELRPRDLTVTVGAGTRAYRLQEELREEGLWLALSGPGLAASVGGLVAAAPWGPLDASHGDLRRQLLACETVTHAGERARWGRAVLKDVAGYGISRVMAGSWGTLGVLHRVTFRLWPAPHADRIVALEPEDGDVAALAARLAVSDLDAEVRPDAAIWRVESDDGRIELRFLGSEDSVELRCERLEAWAREVDGRLGSARPEPIGEAGGGAGAASGRDRDRQVAGVAASPGRREVGAVAERIRDGLGGRLLDLEVDLLGGRLRCRYRRRGEDDATATAFTALLEAVGDLPVRVELGSAAEIAAAEERRPEAVRRLEERVRRALDGRPRHWLSAYL